jgi:hypothetical protein
MNVISISMINLLSAWITDLVDMQWQRHQTHKLGHLEADHPFPATSTSHTKFPPSYEDQSAADPVRKVTLHLSFISRFKLEAH